MAKTKTAPPRELRPIVVASPKGGGTKTTTATHLAALHRGPVLLLDGDALKHSSAWVRARERAIATGALPATEAGRIQCRVASITELRRPPAIPGTLVVIDTPPLQGLLEQLLDDGVCQVVAAIRPTGLECGALHQALVARGRRRPRGDGEAELAAAPLATLGAAGLAGVVFGDAHAERTRIMRDARGWAADTGLRVLATLHRRVVYVDASVEGRGGLEVAGAEARAELAALAKAVLQ